MTQLRLRPKVKVADEGMGPRKRTAPRILLGISLPIEFLDLKHVSGRPC